jgi:filamentous hemagglutinin family protein
MVNVSGSFSRHVLCLAVACACAGTAHAGPAGPVVSAGRASYDPATLTVMSATAQTHIAWQSFNVAAGEVVNFIQPNAQSSVLNHIFNPQSFDIRGGLRSNGSVLFMTDGRVSGSEVNLNLAGMISSSLRLPRMALAPNGGGAAQAQPLTTLADGSIYVISQDAQAVTMANGEVVLNPGKAVELAHASMPSLRVGLTAPDAEAINLSRLLGSKRETGIFAGLFRAPAAARRAVQRDVEPVMTGSARAPFTDDERFYVVAVLYAQMRREALRRDGGLTQVAALSRGGVFLRGAKSRPSLLPQEIQIGAPVARVQEQAVGAAELPVPAESGSPAVAPEPRSLPEATDASPMPASATALAFAFAEPPAEMAATRSLQPITLAFASAEPPAEMAASRSLRASVTVLALASAEPPAEMAATRSPQPATLAFVSAEPPAEMTAVHSQQPILLAYASAEPPAEMTAARSPQPVELAFASAEPPAELVASLPLPASTDMLALASAEPPAETAAVAVSRAIRAGDGSAAQAESATAREAPRSAPTVIVVALAQHSVAHAPQQESPAKEVLIERRAPRYFTDYRGALFFM